MKCPVCNSQRFSPRVDDLVDLDGLEFKVHGAFGVELVQCLACEFLFAAHVHPGTLNRFYDRFDPRQVPDGDLLGLRMFDAETKRDICRVQAAAVAAAEQESGRRRLLWSAGRADVAAVFAEDGAALSVVDLVPAVETESTGDAPIIRISDSDLDRADLAGAFDTVVMSNVLERLPCPASQLRRAARLLRPDGLLFIEVPDEQMLAGTYGFYGAHHINFFAPASLRRLVETEGSFDLVTLEPRNQSLGDLVRTGVFKQLHGDGPTEDGRAIHLVLRNRGLNLPAEGADQDDPAAHLYALGMQCMLLNIHLQNLKD